MIYRTTLAMCIARPDWIFLLLAFILSTGCFQLESKINSKDSAQKPKNQSSLQSSGTPGNSDRKDSSTEELAGKAMAGRISLPAFQEKLSPDLSMEFATTLIDSTLEAKDSPIPFTLSTAQLLDFGTCNPLNFGRPSALQFEDKDYAKTLIYCQLTESALLESVYGSLESMRAILCSLKDTNQLILDGKKHENLVFEVENNPCLKKRTRDSMLLQGATQIKISLLSGEPPKNGAWDFKLKLEVEFGPYNFPLELLTHSSTDRTALKATMGGEGSNFLTGIAFTATPAGTMNFELRQHKDNPALGGKVAIHSRLIAKGDLQDSLTQFDRLTSMEAIISLVVPNKNNPDLKLAELVSLFGSSDSAFQYSSHNYTCNEAESETPCLFLDPTKWKQGPVSCYPLDTDCTAKEFPKFSPARDHDFLLVQGETAHLAPTDWIKEFSYLNLTGMDFQDLPQNQANNAPNP